MSLFIFEISIDVVVIFNLYLKLGIVSYKATFNQIKIWVRYKIVITA